MSFAQFLIKYQTRVTIRFPTKAMNVMTKQDTDKNADGYLNLSLAELRVIEFVEMSQELVRNVAVDLIDKFAMTFLDGKFVLRDQLVKFATRILRDVNPVPLSVVASPVTRLAEEETVTRFLVREYAEMFPIQIKNVRTFLIEDVNGSQEEMTATTFLILRKSVEMKPATVRSLMPVKEQIIGT